MTGLKPGLFSPCFLTHFTWKDTNNNNNNNRNTNSIPNDRKMSRKLPNILVTGTPGTGKSTTCELLQAQVPGMKHVEVSRLVKEGMHEGYDEKRGSHVIDEDKVCDHLEDITTSGGALVDTHAMVDYFPERWFDLVVVLQANNTTLYDRLTSRGYNEAKVQENVQCEIMRVIAEEARESYDENIVQYLASNNTDELETNVERISQWIHAWIKQHA